MMNREFLQDRLNALTQQLNQALANYNAILGSRAECQHLLELLEKAELSKTADKEIVNEKDGMYADQNA